MNRFSGALALLAVIVGGVAVGFAQLRTQALLDEQRRDDANVIAQQCVDSWATATGSRTAIDKAINGVVEAYVVVFPDARPETVDTARAAAADQIRVAQQEIPLPDCDLSDAQAALDNH